MKRMKRTLAALLSVVMLISLLAACGTPAANNSGSPSKPGSTAGENVFVFAGPNNVTQWDPQNENKTNRYMLDKLTYNTLVNPYGENGSIQAELADSWTVSDDGLTWTFKLHEGVKFHNGEDFNADSVVATLQRLLDNPTLVQAAFWTVLEGADKVDDHTVNIKLTQPWGALLSQLVDTPMLPAKALAEKGETLFEFSDKNKPVGTGPWVADKWVPGQDAEFVRNEEYWNWGGDKSNVDRLIYRPVIEDTTRVSGIQAGDLDMIDAVPVEQAQMLKSAGSITVEQVLGTAIVHMGFRTTEADGKYRVFKDVNARQAVSHAVDRKLLVETIAGGGTASSWPCPDTVNGYDSSRAAVPEYSVQMAKDLLGKTDYAGQTISFIVPTGVFARSKEIAQAVLAMLTEAGFTVNLEIMENAAFQDRRASGDYDLYLQRYPFPTGDPDSVVTQRWYGDAHKSGFVSEELNAAIMAQKTESDPVKRQQLLKDMFAIQWAEMAPHMAVYQQVTTVAYRTGITGLHMRADNVFDYSRVSKTIA